MSRRNRSPKAIRRHPVPRRAPAHTAHERFIVGIRAGPGKIDLPERQTRPRSLNFHQFASDRVHGDTIGRCVKGCDQSGCFGVWSLPSRWSVHALSFPLLQLKATRHGFAEASEACHASARSSEDGRIFFDLLQIRFSILDHQIFFDPFVADVVLFLGVFFLVFRGFCPRVTQPNSRTFAGSRSQIQRINYPTAQVTRDKNHIRHRESAADTPRRPLFCRSRLYSADDFNMVMNTPRDQLRKDLTQTVIGRPLIDQIETAQDPATPYDVIIEPNLISMADAPKHANVLPN